jgi:hypothetical protein
MTTIYPPNKVAHPHTEKMVFLAGSIEMGAAVDWQKAVIEKLKDLPVTILNPRRLDWDSSWKQGQNEQPFRDQVLWELSSIAKADVIFFYFDPNTKSPISLMELGLCLGGDRKVVVCCPPTFYRQANVAITCEINGTTIYEDLDWAIQVLIEKLK